MKRKKEMILRRFQDGVGDTDCICMKLLDLKRHKLFRHYAQLQEDLERAKMSGQNYQRILRSILKTGNKLRVLKEVIIEIEQAYFTMENMISVEINGQIFSRLNERSDYRRSCRSKTQYADQEEALIAEAEMAEKLRERMDSYKCRYCEYWHVGHFVDVRKGQKG